MFKTLARIVVARWPVWLALWFASFALLQWQSPDWEKTVAHGEFGFLPKDASSRVAQRKLQNAFPGSDYGSSLLFLIERKDGELTAEDISTVDQQLLPLAREVADPIREDMIVGTISPSIPIVGNLLRSDDGHAAIALVQLSQEFLHEDSWRYVSDLKEDLEQTQADGTLPKGLNVYLSGSAVLGRDITEYRGQSANWVQDYAVWLVVLLLTLVFRAPLIAFVPLVTLSIAVKIAMSLLSLMAEAGWITLFDGIEVYLTVIAYGAGVDYSMFLISRYEEELRRRESASDSLRVSVRRTGTAIAASACTEILGIAMLAFAAFGKINQSGIAISFALCFMLLASLTLTPSLLRVGSRWAFWPRKLRQRHHETDSRTVYQFWERLAGFVVRYPKSLLASSLLILAIPATVGVIKHNELSYGLIAELPKKAATRESLSVLKDHFPLGTFAPVTVLFENPSVNFREASSEAAIKQWTARVLDRKQSLRLADVQSFGEPLGVFEEPPDVAFSPILQVAQSELTSFEAANYYVSGARDSADHVTRARLILSIDPFSRTAIDLLETLETELQAELPDEWQDGTNVYIAGPTASLRSMQHVAKQDRSLLYALISSVVLAVLILLLRKWRVSVFLLLSVTLTYLVTIGVTWLVFRLALGEQFVGIDWTVPLLVFTLLMAVGSDYNVLLFLRSEEEIGRHGLKTGIVRAVSATGAVITGCGVVMAGTFATLLIGGQLTSMRQLGFALAFGVLLDTLLVRPFLVPSFLVLRGERKKSRAVDASA
jgi:RND superfamily putative drug exporter